MSKAKIRVNGKEFVIKATYHDTLKGFPGGNDEMWHDVFTIQIINRRGIKRSFKFYNSYHDYLIGKRDFSKDELLEIFSTFLYEAWLGSLSFKEFMEETGFKDIKKGKASWRACFKMLQKAQALGLSSYDLEDGLLEIVE